MKPGSDANTLLENAKNGDLNARQELEELAKVASPHGIVLNNLGVCYELGYGGTQDYDRAVTLYREAAALECDTAMCNLGLAYQTGRGVAVDLRQAAYWFHLSAKENTKSENGSLRARKQLEELAKVASPHEIVLNNLGVCL